MSPTLKAGGASLPVPSRPHRIQQAKPREVGDAIAQQSRWVDHFRVSSTECMWEWCEYLPGDHSSDSSTSDDDPEGIDENNVEDKDEGGPGDEGNSDYESGSENEDDVDPDYLGGPISRQVKEMINECVRLGQLPSSYQDCQVSYFVHGQYNKIFLLSHADSEEPEASSLLLRIAKPIMPYFKTESEVASLCFARDQGVPVPEVY
ncbi:hypothetical protein PG988_004901 [Apiospora saccharicola]